jgi:hypothetical protein
MSERLSLEAQRARQAIRRLLDAIDRSLAAAREVESARAGLDKVAQQTPRLRTVAPEHEESDAHGE